MRALLSRVAKGKFRVFLIYEFWADPIQGAEPRFSIADYLRCYLVIFIRVKLLTRNLLSHVVSLHLTAKTGSTALTAAENEWKWVKGHKRIGFIELIRKTFQQLSVFSLFVCIKCCKYSLLFTLFGVVPPNSS